MIQIRRLHESIQIAPWGESIDSRDTDDATPGAALQAALGPWEQVIVRSREEAAYHLRRLSISEEEYPQLRSLLAGEGFDLSRKAGKDIIDLIGHRLATGQLVLRVRAAEPKRIARLAAREQPAPAAPAPARSPAPSRAVASPPPPALDGTFLPDADLGAQVDALVLAAQTGAPFCELCEKLRQEQAKADSEAVA